MKAAEFPPGRNVGRALPSSGLGPLRSAHSASPNHVRRLHHQTPGSNTHRRRRNRLDGAQEARGLFLIDIAPATRPTLRFLTCRSVDDDDKSNTSAVPQAWHDRRRSLASASSPSHLHAMCLCVCTLSCRHISAPALLHPGLGQFYEWTARRGNPNERQPLRPALRRSWQPRRWLRFRRSLTSMFMCLCVYTLDRFD